MSKRVELCGEQQAVAVTAWWYDQYRAVNPPMIGYLSCLREKDHGGMHAFPNLAGGWYRWDDAKPQVNEAPTSDEGDQ